MAPCSDHADDHQDHTDIINVESMLPSGLSSATASCRTAPTAKAVMIGPVLQLQPSFTPFISQSGRYPAKFESNRFPFQTHEMGVLVLAVWSSSAGGIPLAAASSVRICGWRRGNWELIASTSRIWPELEMNEWVRAAWPASIHGGPEGLDPSTTGTLLPRTDASSSTAVHP